MPTMGIPRLQGFGPVQNASSTQGSNICSLTQGCSITGPSCYDRYRQYHCCRLYQQTGWTHSHTLIWLVVDLCMWLQTQDIILRARHIPGCLNVIADRLSRLNQPITTEWSHQPEVVNLGNSSIGHVCHSPQHASCPVYVSSSRALSTGDRCPVTGLAGEVNVHVFTVSSAQQSHSEAQDHSGGRGDTHSPVVAVTTVVSLFTTSVCGPSMLLSVPPRRAVTTGIYMYLERQVIPSACTEALMQHYQAAGFWREVLKLAAPMGDPLQIECTTTGGYTLLTGPQRKNLVHLVPQLLKQPLFCMNFLILMACHLRQSKDTGPV